MIKKLYGASYTIGTEYTYQPIVGVNPEIHKQLFDKGFYLYQSRVNWPDKIVLGKLSDGSFYGFFEPNANNTEAMIDAIVSIEAGLIT